MRIDSETKIDDLGFLLRSNGFSLGIEFGSGGYAVTITDTTTQKNYIEYSSDLVDALEKVFKKAFANKKIKSPDEGTIPATPRSKLSIAEISELLASGTQKKMKL